MGKLRRFPFSRKTNRGFASAGLPNGARNRFNLTEAILLTAEFMSITVLRLLTEMPVPARKTVRCLR